MYNNRIMENNTEEKQDTSLIVQNITLGYHFVNDINLQFSPREVKDLSWEDPVIIHKSKNLQDSLRHGILKRLSQEEYDKTMDIQYQKEKKLLLKEQQNKPNYKKKKLEDGKELVADTFDVTKAQRGKEKLDFSGNANDTMSYVTAFEVAQGIALEKGDQLTAEEFGEMVENDSKLVGNLLSYVKQAKNHMAFYATAPDSGGNTGVVKEAMSNFNRDRRYAGAHDMELLNQHPDTVDLDSEFGDEDDDGDFGDEYAEEINLEE